VSLSQRQAIQAVAAAIIEAVDAAGEMGAPGGHIYAALMPHGCTLTQYQNFMMALVLAGQLRQEGECYFRA